MLAWEEHILENNTMVFQIKIHLEEGVGIKNKLKIVLISLIFCIVTLSFYKIIINEIFTSDSIFLKAAKSILIILASLIVSRKDV